MTFGIDKRNRGLVGGWSKGNTLALVDLPTVAGFIPSVTIFAAAAPEESIFEAALEKFFEGKHDLLTIKLRQDSER